MSSQNTLPGSPVPPALGARAPKRKRGHLRVAAIMQAGVEVFAEKGYDAATMTEIAARSDTAIASLYRFFPSKEALADALLLQYAQRALADMSTLRGRVAGMALNQIAGALVDFRVALQSQRSIAVALADARDGPDSKRDQFRAAMLDGLAAIVSSAIPGIAQSKAAVMAAVLLQILKAVAAFEREKPAQRRRLLAELETVIHAYLATAGR